MSEIFSRLAKMITYKWRSEHKLPIQVRLPSGFTNRFDEIIYCPYYVNTTGGWEFVLHEDSGFDTYGDIIPRREVIAELWDSLLEVERTRIMAVMLGSRNGLH
jgi:hypothetical protein